jgi:hypothetical protein
MKTVGVDPQLQHNYDAYYEDDISEWRTLGAIDKADNIRMLCNAYPHSTVLEIGAGEGSVLQRLADSGFGQRHSHGTRPFRPPGRRRSTATHNSILDTGILHPPYRNNRQLHWDCFGERQREDRNNRIGAPRALYHRISA